MTELLIIKSKDHYYRFGDNGYQQCGLNKASVFPLDRVEEVKDLCGTLHQDGIVEATLMKLIIVEEPYTEAPYTEE